jgi:zinc transporter ZupT
MSPALVFAIALCACLASMLGGLLALRLQRHLPLALAFSAGAVLGAAFFGLLPESLTLAGDLSHAAIAAACGFFLYAVIDRIAGHDHNCHEQPHRGVIGAASFSAHSLLDGLAMGLSFQVNMTTGFAVAAAILAHDFADGLNTVNVLTRHGASRKAALSWLLVVATAPVAGAAISLLVTPEPRMLGLGLAAFGGFFLYIGACDLFPASQKGRPGLVTLSVTLLGAGFLYLATQAH